MTIVGLGEIAGAPRFATTDIRLRSPFSYVPILAAAIHDYIWPEYMARHSPGTVDTQAITFTELTKQHPDLYAESKQKGLMERAATATVLAEPPQTEELATAAGSPLPEGPKKSSDREPFHRKSWVRWTGGVLAAAIVLTPVSAKVGPSAFHHLKHASISGHQETDQFASVGNILPTNSNGQVDCSQLTTQLLESEYGCRLNPKLPIGDGLDGTITQGPTLSPSFLHASPRSDIPQVTKPAKADKHKSPSAADVQLPSSISLDKLGSGILSSVQGITIRVNGHNLHPTDDAVNKVGTNIMHDNGITDEKARHLKLHSTYALTQEDQQILVASVQPAATQKHVTAETTHTSHQVKIAQRAGGDEKQSFHQAQSQGSIGRHATSLQQEIVQQAPGAQRATSYRSSTVEFRQPVFNFAALAGMQAASEAVRLLKNLDDNDDELGTAKKKGKTSQNQLSAKSLLTLAA